MKKSKAPPRREPINWSPDIPNIVAATFHGRHKRLDCAVLVGGVFHEAVIYSMSDSLVRIDIKKPKTNKE